jgi:hypothetical protein
MSDEHYGTCDNCGDDRGHDDPPGQCAACAELESCGGCGNDFQPEELDHNGECDECANAVEECSSCDTEYPKDELDRFGECVDCRERTDEEDDLDEDDLDELFDDLENGE